MLGAIVGDIVGSVYERWPIKTTDFPLFSQNCRPTDDTILTAAVASVLMETHSPSRLSAAYVTAFHEFFEIYPDAGYGMTYFEWAKNRIREPYGSWGNGSAMRVSPIAYVFDTEEEVLREAARSSAVTHDHSDALAGAQATALAGFMARKGKSKEAIRSKVANLFGYDLDTSVDEIRTGYGFDVSSRGTVPASLLAFFDGSSYEECIRLAISLGGDSDTLAAITGGIAEAAYGVPVDIAEKALSICDTRINEIVEEFVAAYY